MWSTCTNRGADAPVGRERDSARKRPPARRRRLTCRHPRGTAELETALVIPILLVLLILIAGTLKYGVARLDNIFGAENEAYRQTVAETAVTPAPLQPTTGIEAIRPGLPTYFAYQKRSTLVDVQVAQNLTSTTIQDQAIFLSPSWHYGNQDVNDWFQAYVEESHPPELVQSLGLKPIVPP
ncbi:MAG TPA: hypothetical protein VHM90_09330 [Phycisphaerae bacterium]|nr:hypothetical protein [Phycisphaerae bacterium]